MIPASNVEDLMIREDILDAVAAGKFHIWPVDKIEQGIEILTGRAAGIRDRNGKFAEGTVFALVEQKLRAMGQAMKDFH